MNSNLKLKFDKIYPFNLESERYGYMFKINCDTCRNVVGCLAYDATQAHSINPISAASNLSNLTKLPYQNVTTGCH